MQIKLIIATLIISIIIASLAIYTSFLPKLVPTEVKTKVNFINIVAWKLITHNEDQDLYGRLSEYHGWIISIQVGGA